VSKLERLKEDLGWLKLIFGGLLAIDVSIVAWLAQNYHNAEAVISVGAFIVIMGLTVALLWVNRLAYERIEQLEEL
jgi:succinate-acetate transporter protein